MTSDSEPYTEIEKGKSMTASVLFEKTKNKIEDNLNELDKLRVLIEKQNITSKKRSTKSKRKQPKKERSSICCISSNKKTISKDLEPKSNHKIKDENAEEDRTRQRRNRPPNSEQINNNEIDAKLEMLRKELNMEESDLVEEKQDQSRHIANLESQLKKANEKTTQLTNANKNLKDNFLKLQMKYSDLLNKTNTESSQETNEKYEEATQISKLKIQLDYEIKQVIAVLNHNKELENKYRYLQRSYLELGEFAEELNKELKRNYKIRNELMKKNEALLLQVNESTCLNGVYFLKMKENELDKLNECRVTLHRILIEKSTVNEQLCNEIKDWLNNEANFTQKNNLLLAFHLACKRNQDSSNNVHNKDLKESWERDILPIIKMLRAQFTDLNKKINAHKKR